jgi:endoribonuclease Dicer
MYLHCEIHRRISQDCVLDAPGGLAHHSIPLKTPQHVFAEMVQIQDILAAYDYLSAPLSVSLEWCSPKLRVLVEMLLSYKSQQCIIFVEQRQVAVCLAKVLPSIPALSGVVHCAELVGNCDSVEGVSKNVGQNVESTLQSFREGSINLSSYCSRFTFLIC